MTLYPGCKPRGQCWQGKHTASTIPMALTVKDCKRVVEAQEASGKKYMMMETVVYSREYLYVKEMYDNGEMGKLQFFRSSHVQDMGGWPEYWEGLPPMWNGTHAISPTLALGRNQGPDEQRHFGIAVDDKDLARVTLEAMGITFLDSRFLDFLDPWGNRVEITTYTNIQFSKTDQVLKGMGLEHLKKTDNAIEQLRKKNMAP